MNPTLTATPVTRSAATHATTMMAIVQDKYGSPHVLKLREIDKPQPLDGEVLVRVHAAAVNKADWIALTGRPYAARLGVRVLPAEASGSGNRHGRSGGRRWQVRHPVQPRR